MASSLAASAAMTPAFVDNYAKAHATLAEWAIEQIASIDEHTADERLRLSAGEMGTLQKVFPLL